MLDNKSNRRGRPKNLDDSDSQADFLQEKKTKKRRRGRPRKKRDSESNAKNRQSKTGRPKNDSDLEPLTEEFLDNLAKEYVTISANRSEVSKEIHSIKVNLETIVYDTLISLRSQMAHENTPIAKFIRICLIFFIEHKTGFVPGTFDEKIAQELYPEKYGLDTEKELTDEEIDELIEQEMEEKGIPTKQSNERDKNKI